MSSTGPSVAHHGGLSMNQKNPLASYACALASVATMGIDVPRLIRQIAARPPLWDRRSHGYHDRNIMAKMWKEIASSHNVNEGKVKKKWKSLRDHFRQQIRKKPSAVTWPFFNDMIFLKDQFKKYSAKEPKTETIFNENVLDVCSINENEFNENFRPENETVEMEYSPIDVDSSRGVCQHETNDEDYHFLMSLLPAMRSLPPNQKFLFRIKIMDFLQKEIYQ